MTIATGVDVAAGQFDKTCRCWPKLPLVGKSNSVSEEPNNGPNRSYCCCSRCCLMTIAVGVAAGRYSSRNSIRSSSAAVVVDGEDEAVLL